MRISNCFLFLMMQNRIPESDIFDFRGELHPGTRSKNRWSKGNPYERKLGNPDF
jgi:hypothetical protein